MDQYFEVHRPDQWARNGIRGYADQLRSLGPALTVLHPHSSLPDANVLKMARLRALLPKACWPDYFASSFAYMLAHAIVVRPRRIGLYGIDLSVAGEYAHQRPNMEFLLGIAHGLGIEIVVSQGSSLLKHHEVYGA